MTTSTAQLQEAIAQTTHEIAALKIQNSRIPTLRHSLAAATSSHALSPTPETHARLSAISDELSIASTALETLSVKQAAIGMLERELADAKADERRARCVGIVENFDRLKARYQADSEALLDIFRQMHSLHIQHLTATGRPLLWEADYALNLPPCNPAANSAWFKTGDGVR